MKFNEQDLEAGELSHLIGFCYKLGLRFVCYDNIDALVEHDLVKKTCDALQIKLNKHTKNMYGYTILGKHKVAFDATYYARAYIAYMKAANDNIPFIFLSHLTNIIPRDVIDRLTSDGLTIVEDQGGICLQLEEKVIYRENR